MSAAFLLPGGNAVLQSPMRARKHCLYALICLLWILPGLLGRAPWHPDELFLTTIVAAMARDGLSWSPYLLGEPFLDYPPLYLWLAALSAKLFAFLPAHEGARLANIPLLTAGFGFLYLAGSRRYGAATGWLAVLLALGAAGFMVRAHLLTPGVAAFAASAALLWGALLLKTRAFAGVRFAAVRWVLFFGRRELLRRLHRRYFYYYFFCTANGGILRRDYWLPRRLLCPCFYYGPRYWHNDSRKFSGFGFRQCCRRLRRIIVLQCRRYLPGRCFRLCLLPPPVFFGGANKRKMRMFWRRINRQECRFLMAAIARCLRRRCYLFWHRFRYCGAAIFRKKVCFLHCPPCRLPPRVLCANCRTMRRLFWIGLRFWLSAFFAPVRRGFCGCVCLPECRHLHLRIWRKFSPVILCRRHQKTTFLPVYPAPKHPHLPLVCAAKKNRRRQ